MYGTISSPVLDKMRLNPEYEEAYNNNNVVKLIELAQFASMGEGSDTVYQTLAKIIDLRIENNDWVG